MPRRLLLLTVLLYSVLIPVNAQGPTPEVRLTVKGGNGSGMYLPDTKVTIVATETPGSGAVFSHWIVEPGVKIDNPNAQTTTIIMPVFETTVTATSWRPDTRPPEKKDAPSGVSGRLGTNHDVRRRTRTVSGSV